VEADEEGHEHSADRSALLWAIAQIVMVDIVFSLDKVAERH
jgi:predicted tellurium resistance membrane protein TerC